MNESLFLSKRPSTTEMNSGNPKKSKSNEVVSGTDSSTVFPSVKSPLVSSPQAMPSKGKYERCYIKKSYSIHKY